MTIIKIYEKYCGDKIPVLLGLNIYLLFIILGMNSLFTITGMSTVRYCSVVRLERSWHAHNINIRIWTSHYIQAFWFFSMMFAVPPLTGFGQYIHDASKIW